MPFKQNKGSKGIDDSKIGAKQGGSSSENIIGNFFSQKFVIRSYDFWSLLGIFVAISAKENERKLQPKMISAREQKKTLPI